MKERRPRSINSLNIQAFQKKVGSIRRHSGKDTSGSIHVSPRDCLARSELSSTSTLTFVSEISAGASSPPPMAGLGSPTAVLNDFSLVGVFSVDPKSKGDLGSCCSFFNRVCNSPVDWVLAESCFRLC
jgi:hypothetical protein